MLAGRAVKRNYRLMRLRLGDHVIQTVANEELAAIQTAVSLLRTIFEDHHVDPEHRSCLFFHGCTLVDQGSGSHSFSVIHREDRVILADFTFQHQGPGVVSLPLSVYAAEVVRFGEQVLRTRPHLEGRPQWQQQLLRTQWSYLEQLTELGLRFVAGGCLESTGCCEEFCASHGHLKRPLELLVVAVLHHAAPRHPVSVVTRVQFGPLGAHEVLPLRLNLGDVVLATVERFTRDGALVTLEGIGYGGVRPGDRLYGLQLFYP